MPSKRRSIGSISHQQQFQSQDDQLTDHEAIPLRRALFSRVWSHSDEVKILRSFLHHRRRSPSDSEAVTAVYRDLKGSSSLSILEFGPKQLRDKIRKLRIKFVSDSRRGRVHFSSADEREVFDLSRQLWGAEKDQTGNQNSDQNEQNGSNDRSLTWKKRNCNSSTDLNECYPCIMDIVNDNKIGSMSCSAMMKRSLESLGREKLDTMEAKYRELRLRQLKHIEERMDLMKEIVKLTGEALRESA